MKRAPAKIAHYLGIILSLQCVNSGAAFAFGSKKVYMRLDKFQACDGAENHPVAFEQAQIFLADNNDVIINYNITVRKAITSNLESVMFVERCASKESLDTCQQFYKMRSSRFCSFIQTKGEIWTSLIDCTTPRWECPFKKGTYVGKNCKLDMSLFKMYPMQTSYWRTRMVLNDISKPRSKTEVACTVTLGGFAKL